MDNVFENKENGTWSCKVKTINKKTFQLSYETYDDFESKEEAETFCRILQKKFGNELKKIKNTTTMRFTFSEYLEYYLNDVVSQYGRKTYYDKCKWTVDIVIIPTIENDILLEFLTPDYLNNLLRSCSKLCKSAGHAARQYISVALNYAYKNEYIARNLSEYLDKYSDEKPKTVTYTKENLIKLFSVAKDYNNGSVYLEFLLAICAGLRVGEIRGLMFEDIDFKNKTISIKRQLVGRPAEVAPPKTANSYRTLKVCDLLIDELKKRKKYNETLYEKTGKSKCLEYVSISIFGEYKCDATYCTALKRMCNGSNLPELTFHDLRHLFSTIQLNGSDKSINPEVRLKNISNMLGHKNIGTTLNIYIGSLDNENELRNSISENLNPLKQEV